jgi:hypothetical protein
MVLGVKGVFPSPSGPSGSASGCAGIRVPLSSRFIDSAAHLPEWRGDRCCGAHPQYDVFADEFLDHASDNLYNAHYDHSLICDGVRWSRSLGWQQRLLHV